jgi:hypothetical protein
MFRITRNRVEKSRCLLFLPHKSVAFNCSQSRNILLSRKQKMEHQTADVDSAGNQCLCPTGCSAHTSAVLSGGHCKLELASDSANSGETLRPIHSVAPAATEAVRNGLLLQRKRLWGEGDASGNTVAFTAAVAATTGAAVATEVKKWPDCDECSKTWRDCGQHRWKALILSTCSTALYISMCRIRLRFREEARPLFVIALPRAR